VDSEKFVQNQDEELTDLPWLYAMNHGIFMTPGRAEKGTLSVAHTAANCARFDSAFKEVAGAVTSSRKRRPLQPPGHQVHRPPRPEAWRRARRSPRASW